jgi:hypothetical protein
LQKDIPTYKVENIAIAAVPDTSEGQAEPQWNIHLINLKETEIKNVLVSSKGYGEINGEKVQTSELRHFIEALPGHSYVKVEPIMPDVFGLNNQYWVSFYIGEHIFDKKYVFLPESIQESNLTFIPLMQTKGVLLS